MIPTSPTSPASWTAAAAPAVAPVPAVMAVAPAAAAARDAQAGLEQQRRGQPRTTAGTPGKSPAAQDPADLAATQHARTERAREQAERLRETEEARREAVDELRLALRKAWDASAAVVEQALARETDAHTAAQTARALDAYGGPGDAADKPPGISRRV